MDYQNIFLTSNGRLGPAAFQQAAIILIVISFVLSLISLVGLGLTMITGLASLALIYPWVCIWSKRLHDSGKSGWLTIAVIVAWIILSWIVNSVVLGILGLNAAPASSGDVSAMFAANRGAIIPSAILGAAVTFALVFLGNMILKSDPGDNEYGPPTNG